MKSDAITWMEIETVRKLESVVEKLDRMRGVMASIEWAEARVEAVQAIAAVREISCLARRASRD